MESSPALTCVLFDLDGTLVDTTTLIFESYRHTLETVLDYKPTHAELLGQYGRPLAETMRGFLAGLGENGGKKIEAASETDRPVLHVQFQAGTLPVDESLVEEMVGVYRTYNLARHDALIRSFPHVDDTLAELRRRGYLLGVVTSKGRRTTRLSLGRYDLERYMSVVITLDDTTVHKPHPEPVLKALAALGRPPVEALFVGDSVYDLQAGKAAGARAGAALWGPFARADLEAQRPDYLFESVAEILDVCPPIDGAE